MVLCPWLKEGLTCPSTRASTGVRSLRSQLALVAGYVHVIPLMPKLRFSNVQRAGITAGGLQDETRTVSMFVEDAVIFQFRMRSAGGGHSLVSVTIGKGDLPLMLRELASASPELASSFAEATHIAVKKLGSSRRAKGR